MYKSYVISVPDLEEQLDSISTLGEKIVGTLYTTDTNQIIIIVDSKEEKKPTLFELLKMDKREDET